MYVHTYSCLKTLIRILLALVSLFYLFNMSLFCPSFLYEYVSASMFFLLFVLYMLD